MPAASLASATAGKSAAPTAVRASGTDSPHGPATPSKSSTTWMKTSSSHSSPTHPPTGADPSTIDLVNASLGLSHLQTPAPRSTKFDKLDQLAGRYANQGATFDFLPAAPGTLRIDAAGTAAAALFGEQPITVIARATGDRSFAVLQWSRHRMIEFRFDSAGAIAITASGVTHTATRID